MSDFESFLQQEKNPQTTDALSPPSSATPGLGATPDKFEAFLRQAKGEQDGATVQAAQATTVANASQSAANAASAAPVARQLGVPQAAIETDLPRYQQQVKVQDNTALLSQNPVLAKWVAANPDSARIAQDEYDKMSAVEKLWSGTENAAYAGTQALGKSWADLALASSRTAGAVPGLIDLFRTGKSEGPAWDWWKRNFIEPDKARVQALTLDQNAGIAPKVSAAVGGFLGVMSQAVLTGGGGEALPAAAGVAETLGKTAATAAKSMAFPSLSAAVNTSADVYAQTGDQVAANKAGIGAYLFGVLQGAVPFSAPGGVARRVATGFGSSIISSETQRETMNLLLPPEMRSEFNMQEMLFQGMQGALLGGVLGPHREPELYRGVRQTYVDASRAEEAQSGVGRVIQLGQLAAESKLREADPEAYKRFVETVTDQSNLDAVYVDAKELNNAFAQSAFDTSKMPEVARNAAEAAITGGDVRIPVSDYATHIAGTDVEKAILPSMKASPDGMTYKEGQDYYAKAAETMKSRADEVVQQRQERADLEGDRAEVNKTLYESMVKAGREPSVAKTEAALTAEFYTTMAAREGMKPSEFMAKHPLNVEGQRSENASGFAQSGRYTADEIAFFKSQGIEVPHEQASQAAEITGPARGDQERGRTVAGEPAAVGWREATLASVGRGANRQPAVIYRGSSDGRTSADNFSQLGESTGHPSAALGVWFSSHAGDAARYGQVGEYHLDIRKPKVYKTDAVPAFETPEQAKALAKKLQAEGYDSIAFDFRDIGGPVQFAVFGAHQVIPRETFKQGQRGAFDPASKTISVLKDADLSTVVHELGHSFLDTLSHVAVAEKASEGVKADFGTLLKWFGVKDAQAWHDMSVDDQRQYHEKLAKAFEQYMFEGKAPKLELQSVFGRIRAWMLNVYKNAANIGAELSPEVRGVFDRMLASDDAIREAEQTRSYKPLFDNAKAAGMTAEQFNDYLDQGRQATDAAVNAMQAKSLGDMKWLSNAKSKALKALQRQASAARKEVHAQVENEVSAYPAFQAQDFMRDHGGQSDEFKAATKAHDEQRAAVADVARDQAKTDLIAANPDAKGIAKGQLLAKGKRAIDHAGEAAALEWDKTNPRPKAESRSDIEIVANMFGFESGAGMRKAIADAGNKQDVIDATTDQRMLQQHGELVDPQSVESAANEAVHNEARARFMATGLKALTDSPLPANQIAKAAKEAAEAAIAAKPVGELRSDQYLAAEARSNREALAAAAKDPAAAIEAQRTAILNNRLAKAAMDAQAEVQKGLDFLRKFDKQTVTKAVGGEYMDRINELLSQFDITNRFNTKSDVQTRQQFRDWMASELDKTGVAPEVSDGLLDWTQKRHWKELSVEDFRGLVDSVKSLEHVGREQQLVTVAGQKVALQDMVDRAKAGMADLPHDEPVDIQPHLLHATGLDKISAQWLSLKSKVRGMDAALLKMEQLFQWLTYGKKAGLGETKSGPFLEMFQRAGDAEGSERAMRADSAKDMRELGNQLSDTKVNLNESLNLPLNRPGRGGQWYREELIAAALNTGNAGNLKKLVAGYKQTDPRWSEQSLKAVLDQHLSAAEWKFVQGTWDAIGKYGPQIEALQKRQTGVAPKMVEAQALSTPHGDLKGGYYPVVYDAFLDHNIETKNLKQTDALFENQFARPTTSKGHTIARTDYEGPLQLSLGVIPRHLDQVTHDLAWREAIVDINKFLSHDDIRTEVNQTMGREYTKQFRPWLQAMANDKVFNTAGDSAWESFYRKVRTNATLVGLGFRLSTMLIHGSSAMSNSIGEVGTKWFAKGAAQFATPERWEAAKQFMYDRSPEMANRFNEHDRNINEAIREINDHARALGPLSATQKAVDGARRFAFYGVSALDMGSAAPTWMGAYLKGMEKPSKDGLGLSEEDAVDYANRAVRNAHGGGGAKDLSAVQRDKGVMSMATMFYSFWNHMYNRQRDLAKGYGNLPQSFQQGTGTRDFAKLLARSWWYFVIPQLIHAALKPTPASEEDNGEHDLGAMAAHMGKEVVLGFVSGVPVLRDLANAAVNGRDYTITPLEQAGKSIVKAAVDTTKFVQGEEMSPHAGKNFAQAAGYALGLPTGQLSGTGSFLWDVYNGDADPQGLKDWYTGIQNGRISP